jgi:hypothetical protein
MCIPVACLPLALPSRGPSVRFRLLPFLLILVPACAPGARPAAPQPVRLAGWFHAIRGPEVLFFVTDDAGETHALLPAPGALERAGGALALERRWVRVFATRHANPPRLVLDSIFPEPTQEP